MIKFIFVVCRYHNILSFRTNYFGFVLISTSKIVEKEKQINKADAPTLRKEYIYSYLQNLKNAPLNWVYIYVPKLLCCVGTQGRGVLGPKDPTGHGVLQTCVAKLASWHTSVHLLNTTLGVSAVHFQISNGTHPYQNQTWVPSPTLGYL